MLQEQAVFEGDLRRQWAVDAAKTDALGALHQGNRQRLEARRVVGVVGQHVAQRPPPGVVAPIPGWHVAGYGNVQQSLFRFGLLQICQYPGVDIDRRLSQSPVLAQFCDPFRQPGRACGSKSKTAKSMRTLVLDDPMIVAGVQRGATLIPE